MVFVIARRAIPDCDHVSRFVPYSRQNRDAVTDAFLGLTSAACELGPADKGGLSVTWIEHFGVFGHKAKRKAAIAFRASLDSRRLPPQAVFAYAQVRKIKAAAYEYGRLVRVVWDPVAGNDGHCEIRHFADEDLRLLDLLATEVFGEPDLVLEMDLPAAQLL